MRSGTHELNVEMKNSGGNIAMSHYVALRRRLLEVPKPVCFNLRSMRIVFQLVLLLALLSVAVNAGTHHQSPISRISMLPFTLVSLTAAADKPKPTVQPEAAKAPAATTKASSATASSTAAPSATATKPTVEPTAAPVKPKVSAAQPVKAANPPHYDEMIRDQVDFEAAVRDLEKLGRTLTEAQKQEMRETLARNHAPGQRHGLHAAELEAQAIAAADVDAAARERATAAQMSTVASRAAANEAKGVKTEL
jgi:hypothetical protein